MQVHKSGFNAEKSAKFVEVKNKMWWGLQNFTKRIIGYTAVEIC